MEEKIERLYELRGEMMILHEQMIVENKKIDALQQTLDMKKHKYRILQVQFETLDRELAMIDGRFQRLNQPKQEDKKLEEKLKKAIPKLSRTMIDEIAKQLGITLD